MIRKHLLIIFVHSFITINFLHSSKVAVHKFRNSGKSVESNRSSHSIGQKQKWFSIGVPKITDSDLTAGGFYIQIQTLSHNNPNEIHQAIQKLGLSVNETEVKEIIPSSFKCNFSLSCNQSYTFESYVTNVTNATIRVFFDMNNLSSSHQNCFIQNSQLDLLFFNLTGAIKCSALFKIEYTNKTITFIQNEFIFQNKLSFKLEKIRNKSKIDDSSSHKTPTTKSVKSKKFQALMKLHQKLSLFIKFDADHNGLIEIKDFLQSARQLALQCKLTEDKEAELAAKYFDIWESFFLNADITIKDSKVEWEEFNSYFEKVKKFILFLVYFDLI